MDGINQGTAIGAIVAAVITIVNVVISYLGKKDERQHDHEKARLQWELDMMKKEVVELRAENARCEMRASALEKKVDELAAQIDELRRGA